MYLAVLYLAGNLYGLWLAEDHFVDRAACRNHRVNVFEGGNHYVEQVRPGGVDGFFESGAEFFGLGDGFAFEAVSAGELRRLWEAVEGDLAQAVVVEELLPLADHAEVAVVHADDLDGELMVGDGGEFRDRHLEAAVAGDGEDKLFRAGHLSADGGGKAEAHGAEAAGVDPEAGVIVADELGGPHLVLADVGSDDGFAVGDTVDLGHEVLGLDFVDGDFELEGVLFHPAANGVPPVGALSGLLSAHFGFEFAHDLVELGEDLFGIADDGEFCVADLGDLAGVDVDVDDLGVGGEGSEAAGDAIVEANAEGDDQVGIVHAHVGRVGSVHAGHRDEVAVVAGQGAEAHEGVDAGEVSEFDEFLEFIVGVGVDDATASVDEGTFGFPDHLGGAADLAGVAFGVELIAGEMDGIDRLVVGEGLEDVLRDVYEDGAGASGCGDVEGFVEDSREFRDVLDHEVVLGGWTGDAEGVGFLEGVSTDELGGDLTGDGDDGDGIHHGVNEAGDEVHGSGARGGAAYTDLTRSARVALGGESGILFVPDEDVFDGVVIHGVVEGESDAAGITKDHFYAFAGEAFKQDVRAAHESAWCCGRLDGGCHLSKLNS